MDSVKDIVKLALMIKEAADTVRQNKDVCKEIGKRAERVSDILAELQEMDETKHAAMTTPLKDLKEALERAMDLVKVCREKRTLCHLFKAGSLSKDLQEVNQDLREKTKIVNFANCVNDARINDSIIRNINGRVPPTLPKVPMLTPILFDSVACSLP
jgi:hypothetical protein